MVITFSFQAIIMSMKPVVGLYLLLPTNMLVALVTWIIVRLSAIRVNSATRIFVGSSKYSPTKGLIDIIIAGKVGQAARRETAPSPRNPVPDDEISINSTWICLGERIPCILEGSLNTSDDAGLPQACRPVHKINHNGARATYCTGPTQ